MKLTRRAVFPVAAGSAVFVANATLSGHRVAWAQTGGTPAAGGATVYALPGNAVYPEGVAFDPANNVFYVGSNAEGTIFRGNLATGKVTVFVEGAEAGLTSVNGLKVDDAGRLWASGAATGMAAVYDTVDGTLIGTASNGLPPDSTFVNDVTVSSDGTGYFTDSLTPQLWVIPTRDGQLGEPQIVSFEGTVYQYGDGFNANGIQVNADQTQVIILDSQSASLYRYTATSGEISAIDIGDADLTGGDGLALDDDVLYVCRNSAGMITRLRLNEDASAATYLDDFSDPSFAFPTTIALTNRDTVLVCNSQFDTRDGGEPVLPFSVVEIAIPPLAAGSATPGATPDVEIGTGQDQDIDNATPAATPAG